MTSLAGDKASARQSQHGCSVGVGGRGPEGKVAVGVVEGGEVSRCVEAKVFLVDHRLVIGLWHQALHAADERGCREGLSSRVYPGTVQVFDAVTWVEEGNRLVRTEKNGFRQLATTTHPSWR